MTEQNADFFFGAETLDWVQLKNSSEKFFVIGDNVKR